MRPSEHGPLRVLYLTWRDQDNPEAGGSETFVERTSAVMTELGDQVTIVTSSFPGARPDTTHGAVRVLRRGNRFTCYLHGLAHLARHRDDYDVVVDVQNGVPFWSPLVARIPVVVVVHHVHQDQWPVIFGPRVARFGWLLESKVAPRVYRRSRYVTVSYATFDDLVALGVSPDRIDLAYSGNDRPADEEQYELVPRTPHPSVAVLGRLVPHKQVEIAIDAVADLTPELPDLQLDVVGSGYWHDELVAHAQRRGVADRVHFHGFVDDHTKHTILARSWVSLMPSHKEGWGLTIVEAGLHATPTIAFAHAGGPSEAIVHGETGLLAGDPGEMTEQLRVLLTNHGLRERLGAAARVHARSFDWAVTGTRLEQTLRNVLGWADRAALPRSTRSARRSVAQIVAEHERELAVAEQREARAHEDAAV